jgi:hypothetical protein
MAAVAAHTTWTWANLLPRGSRHVTARDEVVGALCDFRPAGVGQLHADTANLRGETTRQEDEIGHVPHVEMRSCCLRPSG